MRFTQALIVAACAYFSSVAAMPTENAVAGVAAVANRDGGHDGRHDGGRHDGGHDGR